MTERDRMHRELQLLQRVALACGEAEDLDTAFGEVLRLVAEAIGSPFASAWVSSPDGGMLCCARVWSSAERRFAELARVIQAVVFRPGESLTGRVWSSGKPEFACVEECTTGAELAASLGVRSLLAIPVLVGDERVAALNFTFATAPDERSALEVCSSVARHIGSLIRRKRAEDGLRRSESAFRSLIESSPDGILVHRNGRILYVNRALLSYLGYDSSAELLEKRGHDLVHPDEREETTGRIRKIAGGEGLQAAERRLLRKDGSIVEAEATGSRVSFAGEPAVLSIIRDVGARKAVARELQRQALVFDNIADGVIITDASGAIVDWNPAAEQIFGRTRNEMIGRRPECVLADTQDAAPIHEAMRTRGRWSGEIHFARADGTRGTCETLVVALHDNAGQPTGWIGVHHDVSESRKMQESLRKSESLLQQSQKMEAIGQLAGGVAHDFNNLLSIILTSAGFLLEDLRENDERRGDAFAIKEAANRAAMLTRQLLAFSRRQRLEPRVLDLNSVVSGIEKMLRRLIDENIELVTNLKDDLGRVKADTAQLEQVIVNLVVNARDAMPQGGKATIATSNVTLDASYVLDHAPAKPGRYVLLSVTDTGSGMDPETQRRVFEPFFTTKPKGKGTGLGLSTVYGIVKQSGGYIWVYSEKGRGTVFKIYLPRIDEELTPVAEKQAARDLCGTETVLLVEDDDKVRAVAQRILERHGYRVLAPLRFEDAIELASQEQVHLILSDVVMPQMNGPQVVSLLRPFCHSARVMFMSGYVDRELPDSAAESRILHKPFTEVSLAQAVREVLDA